MTTPAARHLTLQYPSPSTLSVEASQSTVRFALDGSRGDVGIRGRVRDPALFRDVILTAAAIAESDLRYKGRDRTAYLAYLMKQGKKATAEIWEAQKAFLEGALSDEKNKPATSLDPILTVHPDEVAIEVFSKDQSSYARLALSSELFENRGVAHGTTFVDLSGPFVDQVSRLRTFRPVDLEARAQPGATVAAPRNIELPEAALRSFLQVQSAATLPALEGRIAPIDLYNVLYALRMRKAKTPPRGLRFELIPGQAPRLVVEPWEIVLECHGPVYQGKSPRVVRTFGRTRLLALARLLPHVCDIRVQLLGPGLPVFWVLDMGMATLSFALTGWLESSWSSAASFDQLMPGAGAKKLAETARALLLKRGPTSFEAMKTELKADAESLRSALQLEALRGRVLFDIARQVYRPRELFAEAIDETQLRYGSLREEQAHRLLGDEKKTGSVTITKLHEIVGEGIEIHGEVEDKEEHRKFTPKFTMDSEGRVKDASCGCPTFRRSGMREGPCEHMIALRLFYGRERQKSEALRQTPEGRQLIRAETRTYVRRDASGGETVYRVSLDDKVVRLQWGARLVSPREQRLWFDSDSEARDAYFERIEGLSAEGFVDADAAGG